VELDGCPDRDGDQIADVVDKCPDQPGPPDREGCPPPEDEEDVVLESERIRINNQILFEFGSDRIAPSSFRLLDDVARVLLEHPDVSPVMIEGHTDSIGSRAINLDLSKRRARSVENYLVGKGVVRTRLRSQGYGFDRPLVPNDTPLNRAKNRRTEFKVVDEIELKKDAVKPAGKRPP
jgi:outer membrane protein OmpA-like peptidoglycan-associated protein